MARTLGSVSLGSTVTLKENGTPVDFYVAKHDYESGLNGAGKTLLVRKFLWDETRSWGYPNAYAKSGIDSWLNGEYKQMFEADIRTEMRTTGFYYTPGDGNAQVTTLRRSVFLLSLTEYGKGLKEGTALPIASSLHPAYNSDGHGHNQWTRSPYTSATDRAYRITYATGDAQSAKCDNAEGIRPALTLSSSLFIADDGSVKVNTAPSTPPSITVPASVEGGETITISWGASTDADGNLSGYKVERLLNGAGTWTQIYQGTLTTTTDAVPAGSTSVQYRVRAYDQQGAVSGYATSPVRTVTNNTAPGAPPSIDYPITAVQTRAYPVRWGAATDAEGNLEGYQLQRKTGGDWADAYSGPETSFSDTIDAGWASVQYRVRARDTKGLLSGWTEGPVRQTVEPAEVLLSGEDTNLGSLLGPVNYQYAATTGDGQNANVTETLNGETLRSFSAKSGERQTLSIPPERIRTGENTITITATQQDASAVRRLTVTKGSIPAPDGPYKVEQFQDEDGKLVFPQTLAEAVMTGGSWGNTLEAALGKLEGAANYGAKIATGSYTGTGISGGANTNKLVFPFEPKIVILTAEVHSWDTPDVLVIQHGSELCGQLISHWNGSLWFYKAKIGTQITGKSVAWWQNGAIAEIGSPSPDYTEIQFNKKGIKYHYAAIG